jgi:hypothetical protein
VRDHTNKLGSILYKANSRNSLAPSNSIPKGSRDISPSPSPRLHFQPEFFGINTLGTFGVKEILLSDREIDISVQSDRSMTLRKRKAINRNNPEDFLRLHEELDPKKLLWNDEEGISIEHEMWICDIANASLQFSLWVKKHITEKQAFEEMGYELDDGEKHNFVEAKLVGECWLSVLTFIREQFGKKVFSSPNLENKFEAKLWLHGTTKGSIRGSVFIQVSPFIKQLVCGVNTEKPNVQKTVSAVAQQNFGGKKSRSKRLRDELQELSDLKRGLEENEYNILAKEDQAKGENVQRLRDEIQDMKENLQKMKKILQKTELETSICFQYNSNEEMFRSQEILIDLGMN